MEPNGHRDPRSPVQPWPLTSLIPPAEVTHLLTAPTGDGKYRLKADMPSPASLAVAGTETVVLSFTHAPPVLLGRFAQFPLTVGDSLSAWSTRTPYIST